jgi:hypothetical protein
MQENRDLTVLTNSDLFWEYNFTQANELKKRAELRAEIDRRLVDSKIRSEILSNFPEHDSRRSVRETAYQLVASLLSELEPEMLWRTDANHAGKLSYLTVGETCSMYRNTAKYWL